MDLKVWWDLEEIGRGCVAGIWGWFAGIRVWFARIRGWFADIRTWFCKKIKHVDKSRAPWKLKKGVQTRRFSMYVPPS